MGELGLGTVQLGLPYGIANQIGKPSHQHALEILEAAGSAGIICFDTAGCYGESESLLGAFLSNSTKNSYKVSTKIQALQSQDDALIGQEIEKGLEMSYRRLCHTIDYLLFHRASDLVKYSALIKGILAPWKDSGRVGKIGVSVYSPEEAFQAIESYPIEVLQVPVNVLDHRHTCQALQALCNANHIEVHGRSIYLQGLLCMQEEDIPAGLSFVRPYLREYYALCRQYEIPAEQAAFTYARDLDAISYFFVGCESKMQLQKNVAYCAAPPLPPEMRRDIDLLFDDVPVKVINPSLWKL